MSSRPIRTVFIVADLIAIPASLCLAYMFRYGSEGVIHLLDPVTWAPILIVAVGAAVSWFGLYKAISLDSFGEGWPLPAIVSRVALGAAIQMGVILAIAYMSRVYLSRLVLASFTFFFFSLALSVRLVTYELLCTFHRIGKARRMVIIGDGKVARELIHRIQRHPELLYDVVGCLNPWTQPGIGCANSSANGKNGMSSLDALEVLTQKGVQELIVCMDQPPVAEVHQFLSRCLERGMRVSLVPQTYELFSSRARLVEIEGVPLVALEGLPEIPKAAAIKRVVDVILGLPLLLMALPILVIASAGLKWQGRRLWRRELRGGRNGKPFQMYRLDVDRRAANAPSFQRFLCRLSISELPQLLNVLLGQMSLVGPRPESLEHIQNYSEWQQRRLNIKPGITGLAQVNGLRDLHSSEEKTRYDLQYMVRWSPIIDIVLLFQTVWTLAARLWGGAEYPSKRPAEGRPPSSVVPRPATLRKAV